MMCISGNFNLWTKTVDNDLYVVYMYNIHYSYIFSTCKYYRPTMEIAISFYKL